MIMLYIKGEYQRRNSFRSGCADYMEKMYICIPKNDRIIKQQLKKSHNSYKNHHRKNKNIKR